MFLTAYCLSYGCWTVIPKQWRESFEDIKENGFDAVALSFSESEMRYSRRTFEMQVNLAHECGLKVLVIPSRIGSRFAGAPLMAGYWTSLNPDAQVPGVPGLACIESSKFRVWIKDFITTLCKDYQIDGIIWDEPKGVDTISLHPETINKFGDCPTKENMQDSFVEFLDELTCTAKEIIPDLQVSMFNMPFTSQYFTRKASQIPGIDYTGFDGCISKQSFFKEEPRKIKHTLPEVWDRVREEAALSGKKTFMLIENMLMPRKVHEEYEMELTKFLEYAKPDHLSCYYYAHNNEAPEEVHNITMRILKRQLQKETSYKLFNNKSLGNKMEVCV